MRLRSRTTAVLAIGLVLVACSSDGGGDVAASGPTDAGGVTAAATGATTAVTGPTSGEPPIVTPLEDGGVSTSPTPPALPELPPLTRGQVDADCVEGWITPEEGSEKYLSPLGVIRRTAGLRGPVRIVDLRYFTGPESPPTDKGYLLVVERWYVKLFSERDDGFQGRFLVEARRFGQGVAAVAPYDTNGFRSPDWIGFQYDSTDPAPKAYERLPGEWSGVPYDFVEGGEGLEIPGLPAEVAGCLDAT
jgi:hypothetical protein